MYRVALLCLLAITITCCSGAPVLERVFVLHRHGARMGMGLKGTRTSCNPPYCALTDNGKAMLLSLGRALAADYKDQLGLPEDYNVSFIQSISTAYARTTISAEATVMGLYDGKDPLPFVDFSPSAVDTKLSTWTSWPTYKIAGTYNKAVLADVEWIKTTIGMDNITRMGKEFDAEELCSTDYADCIGYIQDALAANVSAGIEVKPWLVELWPKMRMVVARFLSRVLGYAPKTDDYQKQTGSTGYELASDAMAFLNSNPAPGSHASLMKIHHYGAHDWTLFSFYTALGMWTPETRDDTQWVVRFAEVAILEQYIENGKRTIKVRRGIPDQLPGEHKYTFTNPHVQCTMAKNGSYWSNECPLEDMWRFINSTAPASSQGICYATPDMMKAQNCDGNAAPPAGSACEFYRKYCPAEQCGNTAGAIADAGRGFMCQSAQLKKETPFVAATVIALMAPSLLFGTIIGFYSSSWLKKFLWRRSDGTDVTEVPKQNPNSAGASLATLST